MTQLFTTDKLIASVKRRGMIPTNQSTFQEFDILELGTEELQVELLPMLLKVREEFYVDFVDVPVLKDKFTYDIPERASGGLIRDLVWGNQIPVSPSNNLRSIPRLELDQLPWHQTASRGSNDYRFTLQANTFLLTPVPASSFGAVRIYFHRRPSELVALSKAGKITDISGSDVTISTLPTAFDTTETYDFVQARSPFNNFGIDLTITGITTSPNVVTFSDAVPSTVVVGDYVALSAQSPIPQIPIEFQAILAQRIVIKILEALGDQAGFQAASAKLNAMENAAMVLITPRMRGEPKKIVVGNAMRSITGSGS